MRAALCRSYGPPEVVRVEEVPGPMLEPGQVRVGITAAAVNFPDVLIVADRYQVKVPPPFVPGSEFAGEVLEVGAGVTGIRRGDRVFGTTLVGAFAEEVVVAGQAVTAIPAGVDEGSAAAFGVAHRTAYHVLRSVAGVGPGHRVVVLGAGGGVGLAAVQIASVLGAVVIAVASTAEKLDAASNAGATHLVDHRSQDLRAALRELVPDGADAVVDPVGGPLAEPSIRSLRWGGRYVTVGYASGEIPRIPLNLVLLKGAQIRGFQFRDFALNAAGEMARNEDELMGLFAAGRLAPHIGATFPLSDAAAALRLVAEGRAVGKVILRITS